MISDSVTPLVLVRHGESTWNELRLVQGQNDEARLTQRGYRQTLDAAQQLSSHHFDLIISSDLTRARETSAVLAERLGLGVEIDSTLRERGFGVAEGRSLDELSEVDAGISNGVVTHDNVSPQGGETLQEFCQRAGQFLERRELRWPGARLLVITHGGTMRVLRSCWAGTPLLGSTWDRIDNATVLTLTPPRWIGPHIQN